MYQKVIDLIYGKTPRKLLDKKNVSTKTRSGSLVFTWMARFEGAVPASYITPIDFLHPIKSGINFCDRL